MKRSELWQVFKQNGSWSEAERIRYAHGIRIQDVEMDSALVDIHRDISHVSPLGQHSHAFREVICCVQGDLEYLLGTRSYRVRAGDLIVIPPDVVHCPLLSAAADVPYERYVIWLSAQFAQALRQADPVFASRQAAPLVLHTRGTRWEYLCDYFVRGLGEAERKAPGWETCLYADTAQLMVHLARAVCELEPCPPVSAQGTLLEQVLDYIQEHLSEKLTVSGTARRFHVSESTLTHLFRRELNTSFSHSIRQRRLAEAKNQIRQGRPLEQVSRAVGFGEYSAFYRAFRAQYGVSPLKYRQMTAAPHHDA